MVVVCVFPFNIADGVTCRAEREQVGVNMVGDACGPVVSSLRVWSTPVIAAVVRSAHVRFAAVLRHLLRKVVVAGGNGAEESVRVVRQAGDP